MNKTPSGGLLSSKTPLPELEDSDGSVKDMFCDSYNMTLHCHAKCGDVKAFFDYEVAAVMTEEKFIEEPEDAMNHVKNS